MPIEGRSSGVTVDTLYSVTLGILVVYHSLMSSNLEYFNDTTEWLSSVESHQKWDDVRLFAILLSRRGADGCHRQ